MMQETTGLGTYCTGQAAQIINWKENRCWIVAASIGVLLLLGGCSFGVTGLLHSYGIISLPPAIGTIPLPIFWGIAGGVAALTGLAIFIFSVYQIYRHKQKIDGSGVRSPPQPNNGNDTLPISPPPNNSKSPRNPINNEPTVVEENNGTQGQRTPEIQDLDHYFYAVFDNGVLEKNSDSNDFTSSVYHMAKCTRNRLKDVLYYRVVRKNADSCIIRYKYGGEQSGVQITDKITNDLQETLITQLKDAGYVCLPQLEEYFTSNGTKIPDDYDYGNDPENKWYHLVDITGDIHIVRKNADGEVSITFEGFSTLSPILRYLKGSLDKNNYVHKISLEDFFSRDFSVLTQGQRDDLLTNYLPEDKKSHYCVIFTDTVTAHIARMNLKEPSITPKLTRNSREFTDLKNALDKKGYKSVQSMSLISCYVL